jgi:hypothetical protein
MEGKLVIKNIHNGFCYMKTHTISYDKQSFLLGVKHQIRNHIVFP